MKIRFLKEFNGIKNHDTCCFTGHYHTSNIIIKESEIIEILQAVKQPKERHQQRKYTLYINNNTLHPDWIPNVERDFFELLD